MYLKKNPSGYCHIDLKSLDNDPMSKSAADAIESNQNSYHKPSQDEIRKKLTDTQYRVTQNEGTEMPFANEYWDNHQAGLYVDVVTGEPLFSSRDKFDSGTGWPSFTRPIISDAIVTKVDRSLFAERVEVRSRHGNSHLGHVFDDGPVSKGGFRYCMNSASLRFIPLDKMAEEGYGSLIAFIK
jgi:peptide methionine sulfoxide reductase msrA/msrB